MSQTQEGKEEDADFVPEEVNVCYQRMLSEKVPFIFNYNSTVLNL